MGIRYGSKRKATFTVEKRLRAAFAALEGRIGVRSDGRQHDTGLLKPYRPPPADFAETYVRMGWDGIDEHYGTNWRVIRRWIEIVGRDKLIAERAAFVEDRRRERREAPRRRAGC